MVPKGGGPALSKEEIKNKVYECLEPTKRLFDMVGIPCHQNSELEADDLMASGAYSFTRDRDTRVYIPGRKAWIVTPDKDALQRVDKAVRVFRPEINKQPSIEWDVVKVIEEKGMRPRQFCDFQALTGDRVDDIPQIWPEGRARKAILTYGSLQKFLSESEEGQSLWYQRQAEITRNVQLVRLRYKSWAPTLTELSFFRTQVDRRRVVEEYGKLPESFIGLEMFCKKKGLF
jgi:5'-3' exonuclease